jgi:hypothetical protein
MVSRDLCRMKLARWAHDDNATEGSPWIPERSATRLREADLNVLSKLGK